MSPWLVATGMQGGHAYESGAVNLFSQLGTLTRLFRLLFTFCPLFLFNHGKPNHNGILSTVSTCNVGQSTVRARCGAKRQERASSEEKVGATSTYPRRKEKETRAFSSL